jgi:hypothetical protein
VDFDLSQVVGTAGTGVTVGSVLLWVLKHWYNSVNDKLNEHSKILKAIEISLASKDGKNDGESALIWREINTDKVKITKMQSQLDRAWDTIQRLAQPRVSDLLREEKRDDPFT